MRSDYEFIIILRVKTKGGHLTQRPRWNGLERARLFITSLGANLCLRDRDFEGSNKVITH